MKMTNEEFVAMHAENGGDICPFCGMKGVVYSLGDEAPDNHERFCYVCGKQWEEVWQIMTHFSGRSMEHKDKLIGYDEIPEDPAIIEDRIMDGLDFRRDVKKEYLQNDGAYCPYCGSDDIVADSHRREGGVYQDVHCLNCFKQWSETWQLIDITPEGM